MKKIIILACSRSGTMFTRKILCDFGLDFGRETILQNGGIGWKLGISTTIPDDCTILHQVRNPIDSIPTLMTHTKGMKSTLASKLNIPANAPLEFAMGYWYTWNNICATMAEWTYRIEDIKNGSAAFGKLKEYFEIDGEVEMPATNFNTRLSRIKNKVVINLKVLSDTNEELANKITLSAKQFGYNLQRRGK